MIRKKTNGKKVFVGLSGGVDSGVSAALLQKEGYDVTGVFIRIAIPGYPCTAGEDKISAQRVAAHLRIPFIELDLSKEYEKEVFQRTLAEFSQGRTPNPDTLCNQKIKFGHFYEFAKSRGADFIATGHYARIAPQNPLLRRAKHDPNSSAENFATLLAGIDTEKDQSYFLWMVPQKILRHTLFPVGGLRKSQVRELAEKFNLPNAKRPDSQGLCFLGPISMDEMLARELAPVRGDVLDESGKIVGTHRGAALYTLGERRGFELSPHTPTTAPHYVVAKDMKNNTITVSTSKVPVYAEKTELQLAGTNWIGPVTGKKYLARFRYRQKLIPAEFSAAGSRVTLRGPHYAPLGQSLVLYDGERCLGGGVIIDAWLSPKPTAHARSLTRAS